jgi:hypothetical protein
MRYHVVSRQGKMYKYLIRGDSEGCVLIWNIPEVSNSQLAQIKQEDFSKPPGKFIVGHNLLAVCTDFLHQQCYY